MIYLPFHIYACNNLATLLARLARAQNGVVSFVTSEPNRCRASEVEPIRSRTRGMAPSTPLPRRQERASAAAEELPGPQDSQAAR